MGGGEGDHHETLLRMPPLGFGRPTVPTEKGGRAGGGIAAVGLIVI